MDPLLLVMRVLHIVLGAFWFGTAILTTMFLGPAMRDAGPEGAKVGAALMRRRLFDALPVAAILTILSGVWLYWRVSGGFQSGYARSATGMTFGFGAFATLVAFGVGIAVMRPSMMRAAALSQSAANAEPSARDAQLAQAQALRVRGARAGALVAALLTIAVIAMSVARYFA